MTTLKWSNTQKVSGSRSYQHRSPLFLYTPAGLLIYFKKAGEFALVHEELAAWYNQQTSSVATINTAVSFAVSGTVLLDIEAPSVLLAVVIVIVGMMKSWIMYVKYDVLQAGHTTAARAFTFIADKIRDLLAVMADLEPSEVEEEFGGGSEDSKEAGADSCIEGALGVLKQAQARVEGCKKAAKDSKRRMMGEKLESDAVEATDETDAESGLLGEASASQVVLRLRLLYRKAVQFRVAHSLFETKYRRLRVGLAFSHLALSTLTSACMFMGIEGAATNILSIALTGLNTVIQATGFAQREADHTNGRIAWASIQRSFATVLMLQDGKEIRRRFDEVRTFS